MTAPIMLTSSDFFTYLLYSYFQFLRNLINFSTSKSFASNFFISFLILYFVLLPSIVALLETIFDYQSMIYTCHKFACMQENTTYEMWHFRKVKRFSRLDIIIEVLLIFVYKTFYVKKKHLYTKTIRLTFLFFWWHVTSVIWFLFWYLVSLPQKFQHFLVMKNIKKNGQNKEHII